MAAILTAIPPIIFVVLVIEECLPVVILNQFANINKTILWIILNL